METINEKETRIVAGGRYICLCMQTIAKGMPPLRESAIELDDKNTAILKCRIDCCEGEPSTPMFLLRGPHREVGMVIC